MKRFGYNADGFSSLDESENGEWVRYEDHASDHAALVAQLEAAKLHAGRQADARVAAEAQVAELKRERTEFLDRITKLERYEVPGLLAQVAELTRERDEARKLATGYRQSAEHECAEVTRLIDAMAAAEKRTRTELARVDAAESECAALRAEVERLRRVSAIDQERIAAALAGVNAAEPRLAAANALLERAYPHCPDAVTRGIDAYLAAQPATALQRSIDAAERDVPAWRRDAAAADFPVSAETTAPDYDPITAPVPPGDMNGPHGELPRPAAPTRTEAEQRVLEAMAKASDAELRWCVKNIVNMFWLGDACRAELARREAK